MAASGSPSGYHSQQPSTTPFPKGAPKKAIQGEEWVEDQLRVQYQLLERVLALRCSQYLLILHCGSGVFQIPWSQGKSLSLYKVRNSIVCGFH